MGHAMYFTRCWSGPYHTFLSITARDRIESRKSTLKKKVNQSNRKTIADEHSPTKLEVFRKLPVQKTGGTGRVLAKSLYRVPLLLPISLKIDLFPFRYPAENPRTYRGFIVGVEEATDQLLLNATDRLSLEATDQFLIEATNQLSLEATDQLSLDATDQLALEATD